MSRSGFFFYYRFPPTCCETQDEGEGNADDDDKKKVPTDHDCLCKMPDETNRFTGVSCYTASLNLFWSEVIQLHVLKKSQGTLSSMISFRLSTIVLFCTGATKP
jgi:hypothetical protein